MVKFVILANIPGAIITLLFYEELSGKIYYFIDFNNIKKGNNFLAPHSMLYFFAVTNLIKNWGCHTAKRKSI